MSTFKRSRKDLILMKKAIAIIFSVLFVFAATMISFDIGTSEVAAVTKTTGQKKIKHVSGEVTAIDLGKKSIIVEAITIYMVKGITTEETEKMLSNIKVGDKVTVDYITKGINTAVSIMRELR